MKLMLTNVEGLWNLDSFLQKEKHWINCVVWKLYLNVYKNAD